MENIRNATKDRGFNERINEKEKEVSDYLASTLELKAKVTSAEEDIETWKNQVRTREKQLFKYKAEQATLLRTKDTDKKTDQRTPDSSWTVLKCWKNI